MKFLGLALILTCLGCKSFDSQQNKLSSSDSLGSTKPLLMIANVENAFDGVDQGTEYPEFSQNTSNWSPKLAAEKADRVAQVFAAANCPEIIVSPEVENQQAADLIAQAAQKKGCRYQAISANTEQDFPIGVAIFTSRKVNKTSKIETGYRPHLRVDFDGLTVIGVHFKSQRDGGEELRQKAASALKSEILKINSKIIIAGDFNSEDNFLLGTKVKSCSSSAPPTHVYHGEWHRLDQIYATVCGSVDRFSPSFLMKNSKPYREEINKTDGKTVHLGKGYSDHLPLYMLN